MWIQDSQLLYRLAAPCNSRMSEKHMTYVWISWETYRRLLAVRGELQRRDGKIRNMDEVIAELIAFWKEYSKVLEKAVK